MTRMRVVALLTAVVAATALVGIGAWDAHRRSLDRAVCQAIQRLDGKTFDAAVMDDIHAAGMRVGDRLGQIARHADGNEGHLDLVSEDYDYVITTCYDLGVPVPNVSA